MICWNICVSQYLRYIIICICIHRHRVVPDTLSDLATSLTKLVSY